MKKRIHVKAPFDLVLEGRETQSFRPGVHLVEPEIADHWYVKAMSEDPVEDPDAITAEDLDDLLNQVEALTARAEQAEATHSATTVDLIAEKERADEAMAQVEALTARVKELEEAAKAAADSAKTGKTKA